MSVKLLFNPRSSFGGGVAKMFDDYASMASFVTEYLKWQARKACAAEFRHGWHDQLPSGLESLLKATIPDEHRRKYDAGEVQYRLRGEPRITIGEKKPMAILEKRDGFGACEIRYYATLQLAVRLSYCTQEGEVKEAGKPYVPARTEQHVTPQYTVLTDGKLFSETLSLTEGTPYYHSFSNGSVTLVTDTI